MTIAKTLKLNRDKENTRDTVAPSAKNPGVTEPHALVGGSQTGPFVRENHTVRNYVSVEMETVAFLSLQHLTP